MRDKERNQDVRGAGNWAPEEQVSAEASAWLTSGAAGAAAGIAPPMGMSPTSWILSVFCRDRGERSQKLVVTPKHAQGRAWRSLAPGSTLSTTDQPPPPPILQERDTSPRPRRPARPGYLQELIEVRDLQEREAGDVLDQLLDLGGVLLGGVI